MRELVNRATTVVSESLTLSDKHWYHSKTVWIVIIFFVFVALEALNVNISDRAFRILEGAGLFTLRQAVGASGCNAPQQGEQ